MALRAATQPPTSQRGISLGPQEPLSDLLPFRPLAKSKSPPHSLKNSLNVSSSTMASSALHLHHLRSPQWRRRQPILATATTPAETETSRVEPRVEQRDGKYWVLKEKFRQGINPQEKMKLAKEPMTLFTENGIRELAAIPIEELDASKLSKDDVDLRLKWLGLFHRRKHQCNQ